MATTIKEAIAAMQAELLPQIPEDVVNQLIGAVGDMVASGMDKRARTVGDKIPSFTLSDANGQKRTLAEFLADGPVVLSFYRGAWCPYCNVELHALQEALPQIKEAGAQLVAISPNTPDHSLSSVEKHNLAFPVLSDIGNTVARELGLVFSLPANLRPIFEQFGFALPSFNGDDTYELPMPATYVVDTDGTIRWAYVNANYTERAEPVDVIAAVRNLNQTVSSV